MGIRIHRVVVRGQFDDLTDEQRAALLAEVDEHDLFRSAFTEWGTFTYDERLVAFNFRYEVRTTDDADADAHGDPVAIGLAKARSSLAGWGLGAKHLRAVASELTAIWSD